MSDGPHRVDAQYMLAAAQYAAMYHRLIWQKMGYILAIQYGGIAAAYVLRGTLLSTVVMFVILTFSCGLLWAIEHDIRSRIVLASQVDYIAQGLHALFFERALPPGLQIPFTLEPSPSAVLSFVPERFRSFLAQTMQKENLNGLRIRVATMILTDALIAAALLYMSPGRTVA